ncbi:MAG TPA: hypothetical protein VFU02_05485 [Polyangiaceae bacterium]|nr:hypothetical protein [Polyangiaceae bacterium]
MSDRELFMYDVRVRDRFLSEGAITKADVDRRLAALPDLAERCEEVDLEQPALSTEPDESVAAAPVELRPSPERLQPSFGADSPVREATPPIAESQPAAPAHESMKTLISAVGPEAQPQDTAGQPASAPPPTASVDADWGDS